MWQSGTAFEHPRSINATFLEYIRVLYIVIMLYSRE
jgi:hypothetical protein